MSTAERSLRQLIQEMLILEAPAPEEDIFKSAGFTGTLQGKRVVILGDSHVAEVYALGKSLEKKFTEQGATVRRFGWGGSAARTWLAGKPALGKQFSLSEVAAGGPYDIAVISLGTNDSGNAEVPSKEQKAAGLARPEDDVRRSCQKAAEQILQVANSVGAAKIYWVGPPATTGRPNPLYSPRARNFIYEYAAPLLGANTIDSRQISVSSDGVHVTGASASQWVDLVFNRVVGEATQ